MNHDMAIRMRNNRIAAHPGLNGLPPRWKKEIVNRIITACKHFTLPKIVDSIADEFIHDFRTEHVLNGLDLTATDTEIVDTARRRADRSALTLSAAKDVWAAETIITHICKQANVPEPKGDTLQAKIKRISCTHWWRRKLRTHHARTIENGNIKLRFVQAKREWSEGAPYLFRTLILSDGPFRIEGHPHPLFFKQKSALTIHNNDGRYLMAFTPDCLAPLPTPIKRWANSRGRRAW